MSDFNQQPGVPTPPPPAAPAPFAAPGAPGAPQAPFAAPGAPQPPAGYPPHGAPQPGYAPQQGYPVPGYAAYPGVAVKPPRPAVQVGSLLLIVGGVLMIAGSFLEWFSIQGESYTGFSGEGSDTKDGPVFVFFGVLALGFGIAQLMARKVLAVAILSIVFGALALFAALADIGDVSDAMDLAKLIGIEASQGPGLWVILVGSLVALAGGIATTAKRRK